MVQLFVVFWWGMALLERHYNMRSSQSCLARMELSRAGTKLEATVVCTPPKDHRLKQPTIVILLYCTFSTLATVSNNTPLAA
jgi:hypothetical protein